MTRTVTFEDPSNLPGAKALKELGDFCFRKVGGRVLLTNDWGYHATLSEADFETFVQGRLPRDGAVWLELKKKGFLRGHRDLKDLAAKFAAHHPYLWKGPSLHIVVVTLRCNLKCVYCHSSVVGEAQREFDMTLDTARRSVDMIFESPNPSLMIEFQGGEPMMNWPVVKFVAEYARKKNRTANRQLKLMMVSNLTLLDEEKLAACADLGISICTSLDGPASVHDANRIHLGGNSHAATARWLERLVKSGTGTGALMTTTRKSLSCAKEIVDEYRRLGLGQIFVRPLHYLGFAKKSWHVIGYEDAEFIAFYRETLDYAIDLNRGGQAFT
ncbi:MAG TPA: radical SAM protein, partial [Elusimicrobiota bacterium]|nr:radical SAM protein [Elusimicrobiota bacterium]